MHSTASSPNAASSSAGTTTATPSRRPQRPCYRQRKPRRSRPTTSATPASPSGQKPATSPAPPSWQDTAASAQPTATPTAAAAPRRAYSPQLGKQTGETNWGSLATGETPLPHQIQKPRRKPSAKERTRTSTGVTPLPPQGDLRGRNHWKPSVLEVPEGTKKHQKAPCLGDSPSLSRHPEMHSW